MRKKSTSLFLILFAASTFAQIPTDNLICDVKFNNNLLNDGSSNDGFIEGDVAAIGYATDRFGNPNAALSLDNATAGWVSFGDVPLDDPDYSISFWINFNAFTVNQQKLISKREICGTGSFFDITLYPSPNTLVLENYASGDPNSSLNYNTAIDPAVWVHITYVLNQTDEETKLYLDGVSDIFGGNLNFSLDNDLFKASLKKAQLPSVMEMLDYPDMFITEIMGDVVYDLKKQTGTIKATSDEGRFKPNQLATLLNALTGFDITKEVYKNIVAQSDITPEMIRFGADLKSQYTTIALKEGSLNQKTNALLGKIAIVLKGTTYNATLGGTGDAPKVKLDTKGALKGVLNQRTEGVTETAKEPVKNILKGFGL